MTTELCTECGAPDNYVDQLSELRALLNEVRQCFTRDDDLPDNLLPRIDAALDGVKEDGRG